MLIAKRMNEVKVEDYVWGMIGLFTGGIAWIKLQLLNIGSDVLQYMGAIFVAASVSFAGYFAKKVAVIAWDRISSWHQKRKGK